MKAPIMTYHTESRKAEAEKKLKREANAMKEEQRLKAEEAAKWALERETRRSARCQTSISSTRLDCLPSASIISLSSTTAAASASTQTRLMSGTDTPVTSIDESDSVATKPTVPN